MDDTDRYGIEVALQLKEKFDAEVTIISMGPSGTQKGLQQALQMGADKAIFVDDNSLKQNLLTPGLNIPVLSPNELLKENPELLCIVPLAWNFFDEIKCKVNAIIKCNPKFYLRYFPKTELVKWSYLLNFIKNIYTIYEKKFLY